MHFPVCEFVIEFHALPNRQFMWLRYGLNLPLIIMDSKIETLTCWIESNITTILRIQKRIQMKKGEGRYPVHHIVFSAYRICWIFKIAWNSSFLQLLSQSPSIPQRRTPLHHAGAIFLHIQCPGSQYSVHILL